MPTLETAANAAPTLFLEQTRVIPAPRADVYAAWTNSDILQRWFCPANMVCPSAQLDAHEGGVYHIEMRGALDPAKAEQPNQANTYSTAAAGTYTKVVPNELLQFTWDPAWNPGELSLVTISFMDVRGGTQVTLRHERFASEQSRDGHNHGWSGALDKLEAMSAKH